MKAFNTLPGQPANTLVDNLSHFHLTKPYDLDLSNKGILGPVLAEIVEGFQKAKISLKSLDASFNTITNSTDIARILRALSPDIKHLDLSNNSLQGLSFDSLKTF